MFAWRSNVDYCMRSDFIKWWMATDADTSSLYIGSRGVTFDNIIIYFFTVIHAVGIRTESS